MRVVGFGSGWSQTVVQTSRVESHGSFMAKTNDREGPNALLSYELSKGLEASSPRRSGRTVRRTVKPCGARSHCLDARQSAGDSSIVAHLIADGLPPVIRDA